MAERSDSMKKAQKKYMEKFAVARVRIERDKYESFQSLVETRGESVSGFFNRVVDETISTSADTGTKPQADQQPQPQQTQQQPRPDGALVLIARGPVSPKLERVEHIYTDHDTGREYYVEPVISDTEWEDAQRAKATDAEDTDELPF